MKKIAAFDVDHTLTRGDTVVPFLAAVAGWPAVGRALAADHRRLAAVARGRGDRDAAKAALLARVLPGIPYAALDDAGERFAARLVARRMRRDVVARLLWHQRRGHEVVLVSAGLAVYLRHLADHLGAVAVLATELEVDGAGRCTGRIRGANVRGEEKRRRLANYLRGDAAAIWAYGNGPGDAELLAMADVPVLVGRTPLTPAAHVVTR